MSERTLGKHYIREWRKFRKMSLRKLAARMEAEPGVELTSHANLGRIEKGEQPYKQDILEAIAEALNCTVVQLLTVDPYKEGEVIDLMRLLRDKDPNTVRAILNGLPSKPSSKAS